MSKRPRKSKHGIWSSNKYQTKRAKKTKRTKPARNKCYCGSKVIHHHWFCDKCWAEKKNKENKEINETRRNTKTN